MSLTPTHPPNHLLSSHRFQLSRTWGLPRAIPPPWRPWHADAERLHAGTTPHLLPV